MNESTGSRRKNSSKKDESNKKLKAEECDVIEKPIGPVADVCIKTSSVVHQVTFKWVIEHFTTYYRSDCQDKYEKLESPKFCPSTNPELQFHLLLYLKGESAKYKDYLALFLIPDFDVIEQTQRIQFSLSLLKENGDKYNESTGLVKLDQGRGSRKFITHDALFKLANELMPNDKLTIFCELSIFINQFSVTNHVKAETGDAMKNADDQLTKDLGAMLANSKLSDVILRVGGKDFAVHKIFLISRSPVFAAMFQHDLCESRQNYVDITDVDVDVFEQLLQFIYTGKISTEKATLDLLVAADKYQLDSLKSICEHSLSDLLAVETVAQMLLLADMHSALYLKTKCIDYINNTSTQVIATQGWKQLCATRPELVVELYQTFSGLFNFMPPTAPICQEEKST